MEGTDKIWRDIANRGNGQYLAIAQSGGATQYVTPYDNEINELSQKMDDSRMYYGGKEEKKEGENRKKIAKDFNEKADASSLSQRASYNNSSESGLKNYLGDKELINDISVGKLKLQEIKEDDLPKELQGKSQKERIEFIEKINKERGIIKEKILALTKKRQENIEMQVKEKSGDVDSFDQKIFECIKAQAKEKEVLIEKQKY